MSGMAGIGGSRLFVALSSERILQVIGGFLLVVIVLRHTPFGRQPFPQQGLLPAGGVVGLLSAVVGSAGRLGAAVFLGLKLSRLAYVATEAVTATLMHLTKTMVYGQYALLSPETIGLGLALGGAMVLGSWTGRAFIEHLSEQRFAHVVEALLAVAAVALIVGVG